MTTNNNSEQQASKTQEQDRLKDGKISLAFWEQEGRELENLFKQADAIAAKY